jgi:hypothetical protein
LVGILDAGEAHGAFSPRYEHQNGPIKIEHYFEEIADLHLIIEHGPDWNTLTRCTVTLNRHDGGAEQNSEEKSLKEERT